MKGQALTNAEIIRKVHNSFARYVCVVRMLCVCMRVRNCAIVDIFIWDQGL